MGKWKSESLTEEYPDEVMGAIEVFLDKNQEAISKFHEASNIAEGVYFTDYSGAAEIEHPHLGLLRNAVRLLISIPFSKRW